MTDCNRYPKFSVLMSLWINEKAEYYDECMQSMLRQTVQPSEIVIVLDGPVLDEVKEKVEWYQSEYPKLIKIVKNETNQGLGRALAQGVVACSNELIARMDTDDIAREDRFEKQLEMFRKNPELDICGSYILEYDETMEHVLFSRMVPLTHEEIAEYQKRRTAITHVTAMYKKSMVLRAGNYEHCPGLEDQLLWTRMLLAGAKVANIDDSLVFVRTGYAMMARRGGWRYFLHYRNGRKKILATGYIDAWDYLVTVGAQLVLALIPDNLRMLVYKKILRKERED